MTDIIQQVQDELNESVINLEEAKAFFDQHPSHANAYVVEKQAEYVEKLRYKLNSMIVAYDSAQ